MDVATITAKPAAGPLTLTGESDKTEITHPPTTPAIMPARRGAFDASATPRQRGNATRKTTRPAGRSFFRREFRLSSVSILVVHFQGQPFFQGQLSGSSGPRQ